LPSAASKRAMPPATAAAPTGLSLTNRVTVLAVLCSTTRALKLGPQASPSTSSRPASVTAPPSGANGSTNATSQGSRGGAPPSLPAVPPAPAPLAPPAPPAAPASLGPASPAALAPASPEESVLRPAEP